MTPERRRALYGVLAAVAIGLAGLLLATFLTAASAARGHIAGIAVSAISVTAPARQSPSPPHVASGFAPYVDTSRYPPYDMIAAIRDTDATMFNLAFVVSGGGCAPAWAGSTGLGEQGVPGEIPRLRQLGGDVRVSFGGADGTELARVCPSATALAQAYQQVITTYRLDAVDFDIEGADLADTAATARRDLALAQLQRAAAASGRALAVSFSLPALPSGLTDSGRRLLVDAHADGVVIAAVNVLAMDYGDQPAPHPAGRMGRYAIDAATAAHNQIRTDLDLDDAQAWQHIAVTPMVGVNDVTDETFTVADAVMLTTFASANHLAWLSMWSVARDQPCGAGDLGRAVPTCSGTDTAPLAFGREFAAYHT